MPLNLLAILLAGVLACGVDFAFALPVEIVPESASKGEEGALPDDQTTLQGDRELLRALLSEGAMTALMVSDLRNIGLANGSRGPSRREPKGTDRASRGRVGQGEYVGDPLEFVLRKVVPIAGERGPASGSRQASSNASDHGGAAPLLEDDKEVLARVAAGREILLRAAEWVITPEYTEDGQRGFAFLGVGGFTVARGAGQTRVAFHDIGLVTRGAAKGGASGGGTEARHGGAARWEDEYERNAMLKFWFLLWDALTHPLGLALLLVFGVARLLLGVVDRRPAYGEMVVTTATGRSGSRRRRR